MLGTIYLYGSRTITLGLNIDTGDQREILKHRNCCCLCRLPSWQPADSAVGVKPGGGRSAGCGSAPASWSSRSRSRAAALRDKEDALGEDGRPCPQSYQLLRAGEQGQRTAPLHLPSRDHPAADTPRRDGTGRDGSTHPRVLPAAQERGWRPVTAA